MKIITIKKNSIFAYRRTFIPQSFMLYKPSNHGLQIPIYGYVENSRRKQIDVDIKFYLFPIFVSILFISISVVSFLLYYAEGRYTKYIPTISETATSSPNVDIFSIFSGIIAFLMMILFTLYISSQVALGIIGKKLALFARFFSLVAPISLIVLSSCSLEDNFMVHNVSSALFFISLLILFITTMAQIKKKVSAKAFYFRVFLIVIMFIAVLGILLSTTLFKTLKAVNINA